MNQRYSYPGSLSGPQPPSDPKHHWYPFVLTRHTNDAWSQPSVLSTRILAYTSTRGMGENIERHLLGSFYSHLL